MKIIEPSVEILTEIDGNKILKDIELAARTCYKSEGKITEDTSSAIKIIKMLLSKHHEAMIEFGPDITVKITTDIGAQRDLSRHRHISMACESTRYNAYNKDKFGSELTFINPVNIEDADCKIIWADAVSFIENCYMEMAELGCKPDQMRMILPLCTKTEFCMKANIREWRHILRLRCSQAAHPSVQQVMKMLLKEFHSRIPVVFDDLYEEFIVNEGVDL